MTDSIAVLPPGWRALDNNGNIITQATLYFYETDGVTAKTVYSDADLSESLGTEVSCNSGGYPVSGGGTQVIVYVGSDSYNVLLKDGSGTTIWSHEDVKGAVDTSDFVSSGGLVAASPIVTVSSNTTRTTADAGKLINGNTTGGDITTTLPSAVTAGNGFRIGVRHGGTANQHVIASGGGSFVGLRADAVVGSFALTHPNEGMWFVSNGSDWVLDVYVPPLRGTTGVIQIADILSTPPGSPEAGARYLVGASPTGAWASMQQHDIAEYTGSAWARIRPAADCGWIAYVQDEDLFYFFRGSAWQTERATATIYGGVVIAGETQMESASTGHVVPVHLQHRHPGHPKLWALVSGGGSPSLTSSYGVTSIGDPGAGTLNVTFATAFGSANSYCVVVTCTVAGGDTRSAHVVTRNAGSCTIQCTNQGGGVADPNGWNIVALGDQ